MYFESHRIIFVIAAADTVGQFIMLITKCGYPTPSFLGRFASPATVHYIHRYKSTVPTPVKDLVHTQSANLLDAIREMLVFGQLQKANRFNQMLNVMIDSRFIFDIIMFMYVFADPDERPTAADALELPAFETYHHPDNEPVCGPIDSSFEAEHTLEEWRQMTSDEIADFQAKYASA